VLAVAGTGCIESNLVMCADGLACPGSDRCDEVHHSCVAPDQLVVCGEAVDGADCTAGPVSGGCFDRVCLARGCGNRVVEPGEMCDDGNQISGDGCSGDCRSTETCGNGFVDPGEQCDDGDLISHDGCDSRCTTESAAWSPSTALAPGSIDASTTAYDAARGRLVSIGLQGTWEWDGTRWTLFQLLMGPDAVFYDPDRRQVEAIAGDLENAMQLYGWTGERWLPVDTRGGPSIEAMAPRVAAAYDAARHELVVVEAGPSETSRTWTIDATGAWRQGAILPGTLGTSTAAFDAAAAEVVIETRTGVEWTYDGDAWATSPTSFGPEVSLAFDPDRGHLVAFDNLSQNTYERIGTEWTVIATGAPCRCETVDGSLPLYYDRGSAALALVASNAAELCSWHDDWSLNAATGPFSPIGATYDPLTRRFVVFDNPHLDEADSATQAWTLTDDGWRRIAMATTPTGGLDQHVVYSPGRAATVLYAERPVTTSPHSVADCAPRDRQADTWSFDGTAWTWIAPLSTGAMPCTRSAATYDPEHGRILLATSDELWSLGDRDAAWVLLDPPSTSGQVRAAAWDARRGDVMAARVSDDPFSTPLYELRDRTWVPIEVIPGSINAGDNVLVSDQRAGGVIAIERSSGDTWERIATDWIKLPPAPMAELFASWTAYNPVDGSVLVVGRSNAGSFLATLARTSATPFESCKPGEDLDGDGLAGCDDPDCYWLCSRCLPHTTCR